MQREALEVFFLSAVFWGSMLTTRIADRFGYRTAFLASVLFQCLGYTTIARTNVAWVAIFRRDRCGVGPRDGHHAPYRVVTGLIYPIIGPT